MTEALLSTIKYIFENFDIENIIYGYAEENFKSKGLNNKNGFEFYKEYMEHYIRIDKEIKVISNIMTKERFKKMYDSNIKRK